MTDYQSSAAQLPDVSQSANAEAGDFPSPRLFVVNPRYLGLVRGDPAVDLQAAWRFNLRCGALLILGLLPLILPFIQWRDWQTRFRNEVPGIATILAHRVQTDNENGTIHYVAVTFTQPGTEAKPYKITEESKIPVYLYNHVADGAMVNAILTRSGGILLTGPELPPYDLIIGEVIAGVGVWALVLVILFVIRVKTLRRRLLRLEGTLVDGQVLMCRPLLDDSERFAIALSYRFISPQTSYVLQGTTIQTRPDLEGQAIPATQTPVKIRYVDDSLYEVL